MVVFVAFLLSVLCVAAAAALLQQRTRRLYADNTVGFLHATSGAGGGGERVMWVALDQLQRADERRRVKRTYVVFTNSYSGGGSGDANAKDAEHRGPAAERDAALLALVQAQHHIQLTQPVKFVFLRRRVTQWLRADRYPRLTLLLQTVVGGLALFYEAAVANAMTPIVFETVGVPMTYPLLSLLAGSAVVSYTHFPVVSSSMMERVRAGTVSTTNNGLVVSNPIFRLAKLLYYQTFAFFYRLLGQFPATVFTNSSWTQGHVGQLFWPRTTTILYPPCDVADFAAKSKPPQQRDDSIVSVGQFRPEKNHMLQLHAFRRAVDSGLPPTARLVMLGGARDANDAARAAALVREADALGIAERVDVKVDAPFTDIVSHLTTGAVGLHTMLDEHFGIVILEYLAAGTVALAHNSGGVRLDIVCHPDLGFLAASEEEFADGMVKICRMRREEPEKYAAFQRNGERHVAAFTDTSFGEQLCDHLAPLLYR